MGPKEVPDTKTDRPTDHRSQHQINSKSSKFIFTRHCLVMVPNVVHSSASEFNISQVTHYSICRSSNNLLVPRHCLVMVPNVVDSSAYEFNNNNTPSVGPQITYLSHRFLLHSLKVRGHREHCHLQFYFSTFICCISLVKLFSHVTICISVLFIWNII
jgi:hypothetical protein